MNDLALYLTSTEHTTVSHNVQNVNGPALQLTDHPDRDPSQPDLKTTITTVFPLEPKGAGLNFCG